MNLSALKDSITRHEGEVLHAYKDSLGLWTIGVGRLIDEKGGGITHEEAQYLLEHDIAKSVIAAKDYAWFAGLTDARQNVVVEMIFQLGVRGFGAFLGTHAAIAAGYYDIAAQRMLASKWATQTPKRAQELASIMSTGAL